MAINVIKHVKTILDLSCMPMLARTKMICSHYYWRIKKVNLCKRCLPFQNHVPKLRRHHLNTSVHGKCSTFLLYIWVYVERFMVEGNLRFCVCVYVVHQKACFVGLPSFKHWTKIFIIKRTERQRRIKFNPIKTLYIIYLYININIHYSYLPLRYKCEYN